MTLRLRALMLCLALFAAPLVAGAQVSDPDFDAKVESPRFATRHPQLLIDQGHHEMYTMRGRYDVLAKLATADGFDVLSDANPFTLKDLKGVSVLLIADALGVGNIKSVAVSRPAFTVAECDVLAEWVRAGGSLLLVAEQAPMGDSAQRLAKRFGVDFSDGYLVDPTLADTSLGASTLVFSTATGTLGDHPIIHGRSAKEQVGRIRTYTGQSLAGPEGSTQLLKVTDLARDYMLGAGGVKGTIPDSLKHSAAGRAQGIAFAYGKGRVVVLGEATMLAAQVVPVAGGEKRRMGMNSPGFDNRQFALNVLRWLARGLD